MIQNYIRSATRNLVKRKVYSFINAFGLSVGFTFCILIYLYVQDERSFDEFHENKNRIYRLEAKTYDLHQRNPNSDYNQSASLPLPLLKAVKDEIPEVEFGTHFSSGKESAMRYEDKVFTETYALVEADFFAMFSFPLIKGNREKLFTSKNEIVITPAIAEKYFGDEEPLGKTVTMLIDGEEKLFTVTGVVQAPPSNSSLTFSILLPMENEANYERNIQQWSNSAYPTFIQLSENANAANLNAKLEKVIQKYMSDKLERWAKEHSVPEGVKTYELQSTNLADIHFKPEVSFNNVSDPKYSFILSGIGLLVLVIACINYITLALTTSTSRRIEVGVRKVIGAQQSQLIYQFGFESIFLAMLSLIISILLVVLVLPFFNDFTQKSIALSPTVMVSVFSFGLLLSIIVGLVAGSYPSLFLSRFKPASVLKGGFTSRLQAGFTKPLVVFQFALSAFLIVSSVIMFRQMKFITTKDLGYNQDQVIVIPTQAGMSDESDMVVQQYRQELSRLPYVVSVAGTSASFNQGYMRFGYKVNDEMKVAYVYAADPYYINTLDIQLVMGRNFDPQIISDSSALIVNEALVKDMGWTDPLAEHLNWREDSAGVGDRIIGVVKDYHFLSLERGIAPMFISLDKTVGHLTTMLVKVSGTDIPTVIEGLQRTWQNLYPNKPFNYSFLDEDVARQYESYTRWMQIMKVATGFAIFIASLGLFGLSGINALNRTKEIGIRKVVGAGVGNIFLLLNRQYIWLAMIAFVIATPASWYVMNKWLAGFEFRITIGWEVFAVSMLAGVAVALLAVTFHTLKAALVNPAETLKYE